MKTKIFIDGSEGTTGLRINERFKGREDLETRLSGRIRRSGKSSSMPLT